MHAMATHHGGPGQRLDRENTILDTNIDDPQELQHENTADFETKIPRHLQFLPMNWKIYTRELKLRKDNLQNLYNA